MTRKALVTILAGFAMWAALGCPQPQDGGSNGGQTGTSQTTGTAGDSGGSTSDSDRSGSGGGRAKSDSGSANTSNGPSGSGAMSGDSGSEMPTMDRDAPSGQQTMGMEGSGDITLGMEGEGDVILGMEGEGDTVLSKSWRESVMPQEGPDQDLVWELKVVQLQIEAYYYGEGEFPGNYSDVVDAGYALINPGVPQLNLSEMGQQMQITGRLHPPGSREAREYSLRVEPDLPMTPINPAKSRKDWSFGKPSTLSDKFGLSGEDEIRTAVKAHRRMHDLANLTFFYTLKHGNVPESGGELVEFGDDWIVAANMTNPYNDAELNFSDSAGSGAQVRVRRENSRYGDRQTGRITYTLQNVPEDLQTQVAEEELFSASLQPSAGRFHTWR